MAVPTQSDPTKVMGRRGLAALIDAALVIIPAVMLVTASMEYLPEDRLDRSGEQFCDDFLEDQGGFCFDMTDVDERVYFSDTINVGATAMFWGARSEEHTSELQSLMRISYAVFCLKKKKNQTSQ